MKTFLVTFGVGTKYRGSCVIVRALTELDARSYAFAKYGQQNVAFIRDYEQNKNLIKMYNYKILEERNV